MRRGNILIVYSLVQYPPRPTINDALYAFQRYSRARCFYLNLAVRRVPRWLTRIPFDAVIFQTTFLATRWSSPLFSRHRRKARRLKGVGGRRAALPQDEFLRSTVLAEFIEEFEIDHVFSVGPPSEWPELYPAVDRDRVGFSQVLTGYLSPETLTRIEGIVAEVHERPIDIGYRAWHALPWLGRHGALKTDIAHAFQRAATDRGLRVDISTRAGDTLVRDDWYRFLASSKYAIGMEGGASIHDPHGTFKERTERYVAEHPDETFEEVEANCFPGEDGKLAYVAISPRHLEACATRTCQILVEGEYNGILRPGEHYIELRRDLSNLDDVLDIVERDTERERVTQAAYGHVVSSGAYTYERFVRDVEAVTLAGDREAAHSPALDGLHRLAAVADRLSWAKVATLVFVAGALRRLVLRTLPKPAVDFIRRRMAGTMAETAALQSAD